MEIVATEEEWMRLILLWQPHFRITHRDGDDGVVTEMNMWAVGRTFQGHESLGHALAYALQYAKDNAWDMCKLVENERT